MWLLVSIEFSSSSDGWPHDHANYVRDFFDHVIPLLLAIRHGHQGPNCGTSCLIPSSVDKASIYISIFSRRKRLVMPASYGSGAGSSLPAPVLIVAAVSTAIAVVISTTSIYLHLKNYRKPKLQRY